MASIDNNQNEELKANQSTEHPQQTGPVAENHEHTADHDEETDHDFHAEDYTHLSMEDIAKEAENIVNSANAGAQAKKFGELRDAFNAAWEEELKDKKEAYIADGGDPDNFEYQSPLRSKFNALVNIFKEKQDSYHKEVEKEHAENLVQRRTIIDKLKNLYTNTEAGTNLFKAIREIKEEWQKAGQVAKSEFKTLSNDYFHHLNQFYQMLDLNKEYREQEYAHNLEKRQHIIARAKELKDEPVVQKALNELQYLHKLWKEEAEPVAEEFRDSTWDEFKEISNVIHQRKAELFAQIEADQKINLEKKNEIIEKLKKLSNPEKEPAHSYWQSAIKKVEELRNEFISLGSVPKKLSNQNWTDFKETLRAFNASKNNFYKGLKKNQQENLERKLQLIQTAKDNQDSEDWDTAVPLFKKLQEEWKAVGHVPRSQSNRVWDEFRDACNHFFAKFREKGDAGTDDWRANYKKKKALLDELKDIEEGENSAEAINRIKNEWNAIGKVPRDKISINTEFNKALRSKMRLNRMKDYELSDGNLSETQLTDKARKIKNQISDMEAEVSKLENNLAFFSNPTRENPLLKATYDSLDAKKEELEGLRSKLHQIITEHDQPKPDTSEEKEENPAED
ncbi:DUF349 domain-containing protein [Elizabethkingia anophelis]|uniref:DUF349 domain-containing protein n=1 Tax=Elizabethkingia anophelis TaxID=1117645 RepID=UPI00077E6D84|nr:DUF349 domain-containing protein [Elizabethkingia anophelis]AMR41433.1 hypothetical protein A2T74_08715 [Elizabethkingia anophelis]AMX48076.1 hypothetical protein A4C56_08715 [Elizabethkingia anophelis]AMX51533.1 hypothetical protein A2T72_08715 [Elizabethkingia anophelis]AMX54925.1 hypothetical protein A2T59_08715 [Elizabethkingia anophelis]EGT4346715.1 DUF349 domain-containing protein [Elizabethkingia anophelis]